MLEFIVHLAINISILAEFSLDCRLYNRVSSFIGCIIIFPPSLPSRPVECWPCPWVLVIDDCRWPLIPPARLYKGEYDSPCRPSYSSRNSKSRTGSWEPPNLVTFIGSPSPVTLPPHHCLQERRGLHTKNARCIPNQTMRQPSNLQKQQFAFSRHPMPSAHAVQVGYWDIPDRLRGNLEQATREMTQWGVSWSSTLYDSPREVTSSVPQSCRPFTCWNGGNGQKQTITRTIDPLSSGPVSLHL